MRPDGLTKIDERAAKLESIQIMNFRGFGKGFNGDDKGVKIYFHHKNTLFYGPNGSGKSSLCDALEYKLTGEIREAVRRSKNISEYTKRIGSDSNPSIKLLFTDLSLNTSNLNEEQKKYFSQSFIEKNRIQEFSLFGSKDTNIKKENILSVLIGMDDLSLLAKSFVQTPAFKTNLQEFKRSKIIAKLDRLENDNLKNLTLSHSYKESISTEESKAREILKQTTVTIADIDQEIEDIDEQIACLNKDNITLSTNTYQLHNKKDLENLLNDIYTILGKYRSIAFVLSTAKRELSFSKLYDAMLELETEVVDICPACNTPIEMVTLNPFNKARVELQNLYDLKEQEREYEKHSKYIDEKIKELEIVHNLIYSNIMKDEVLSCYFKPDSKFRSKLPFVPFYEKDTLENVLQAYSSEIQNLDGYFEALDIIIKKQDSKASIILENHVKIKELNNRKSKLNSVKSNWETAQNNFTIIQAELIEYSKKQQELTKEKQLADNYNCFIDGLIDIYPIFYSDFQDFKNTEFQTKFGRIENEIAGFYNQINNHDPIHEKIESFKFNNVNGDYKIEFKSIGATDYEDASIKFSEGHLRSLGLSILLANAKINSLPFIIFDDVVNAIDSDHRANIIKMMIQDTFLKNTQQIISTHDRLYRERFSNENKPSEYDSYILRYSDTGIITIPHKICFNSKIKEAIDNYDIRQALVYCRIWFETIAKNYCMKNNIELKGKFIRRQEQMLIEPTISDMYRELSNYLPNNKNLEFLYHNQINFQGLNQEHHSFDEFIFNFIHSKTSKEVEDIYTALINLNYDIGLKENYKSIFDELRESYKNASKRVKEINSKMPEGEKAKRIKLQEDIIQQMISFEERMKSLSFSDDIISDYTSKMKIWIIKSITQMIGK
ncbi:MAG TPA: AAA family ATPase [Ignavibacteriales bacterium]|nr:AAA family ATPase [Ignavibacteriales bacterium]